MNRRKSLAALTLGTLVIGCPAAARVHARPAATGASRGIEIARMLVTDIERASLVGRSYLRAHPERNRREVLLADAGLARLEAHGGDGPSSLRSSLAARREQEFLLGDTVMVDGWLLARSEASLCALLVA